MEFVWFLKNNYIKTLKSDTHLPPVNRTLKVVSDRRKKKYIEMFGYFTEPFNYT